MARPFVSVVNLGCRVNRVESDRITIDLDRAGFSLVDEDDADLIVINTCAVTGEAEAKTRKAVRHALARARRPWVIATGCAANLHPGMLEDLSDRVVVERSKVDVARRAAEVLGYEISPCACGDAAASSRVQRGDAERPVPVPAIDARLLGRTRLGVKIQDGCNNRCTYCIVWKARGPERSVPVEAVLDQVRAAVAAGVPEVVLTGVNLGAYDGEGPGDSHVELDELVRTVLDRTGVQRVRLSSIEPMDVSDRLIDLMAREPVRIAPFLHLPLQSGCTETLERMARPYTARGFLELARRLKDRVPAIALSCDVIVGFPGETDEEFGASYDLCREVGFARMHVFRYSARPGTIAASAPDQVPPEVMAERSRRMRDLAARMALDDARRRIGTTEQAVLESDAYGTLGSFHRILIEDAGEDAPRPQNGPSHSLLDVGIIGIDEKGVLRGRLDAASSLRAAAEAKGA